MVEAKRLKKSCVASLVLLVSGITAYAQERGPIRLSPMTPEEVESQLAESRAELEAAEIIPEEIEDSLRLERWSMGDPPMMYRDADIRAVFPEILETDERSYTCHVTYSNQSQTFGFISRSSSAAGTVVVKTVGCRSSNTDLYCNIEETDASFLGDPHEFFYIDSSVSVSEAHEVLRLFRKDPGMFELLEINSISKQGEEYTLQFGREGCACSDTVTATIQGALFWKRLEFGGFTLSCV